MLNDIFEVKQPSDEGFPVLLESCSCSLTVVFIVLLEKMKKARRLIIYFLCRMVESASLDYLRCDISQVFTMKCSLTEFTVSLAKRSKKKLSLDLPSWGEQLAKKLRRTLFTWGYCNESWNDAEHPPERRRPLFISKWANVLFLWKVFQMLLRLNRLG